MALYTFGEQVELKLPEDHSAEDTLAVMETIDNVDNKTLLFEAISMAADRAEQVPSDVCKRKVLIVISDGEDFTIGKTVAQEAQENLKRKGIPAYAYGITDTARENINNFGEFASRDTALGGNDEREQTLNQLLAEMDGFDTSKGLLLLAATNRPEILDPALLRPGRFDRRVIVERPDLKGRVDILKVHAKDVRMDESVDLEAIALATSGAVGSDLANMINEAAINAVKHGRQAVSQADLFEAVEVVLVGKEKKDRIMSKEERRIVSYHEVGHALVSALQKDAEPVQKITIVPRTMGALGYVMQTPEEEKFLNTKKELEAMLVGLLAGRAAEEIVFDTVTTGASNDIERATKVARAMITQYGMSEKFGLIGLESIQSKYLDGRAVQNCGPDTAAEIDKEVMVMLKMAYEEAKALLSKNREALDKIAAFFHCIPC